MKNLTKSFLIATLIASSVTGCANNQSQGVADSDPVAQMLYSQLQKNCGNVADLSIQPDGATAQDSNNPNYYRYMAKAAGQAVRVQVADTGSAYNIYGDHNFTKIWGCVQDAWITSK